MEINLTNYRKYMYKSRQVILLQNKMKVKYKCIADNKLFFWYNAGQKKVMWMTDHIFFCQKSLYLQSKIRLFISNFKIFPYQFPVNGEHMNSSIFNRLSRGGEIIQFVYLSVYFNVSSPIFFRRMLWFWYLIFERSQSYPK